MTTSNTTVVTTTANNAMIAVPDMTALACSEGMNVSGRVFYSCLAKIQGQVPFDPAWANGTGYYDSACKLMLPVGTWGWSHDIATNRYIILIGTRFGAVAVFERYRHGSKAPVIVCNVPRKGYTIWQTAGLNSQLGERVLTHVLGDPEFPTIAPNIGMTIETMSRLFLKSE